MVLAKKCLSIFRLLGLVLILSAAFEISSTPDLRVGNRAAKRIVIAATTMLDGKGRVLHDTRIVVEGSKIVAIDPKANPVHYDLRGLTVIPGWMDSHVHIIGVSVRTGRMREEEEQLRILHMQRRPTPG